MTEETPIMIALTPTQAAKILSAAGNRRITEAMVRADIKAGAPINADGTVNLIHYAAWLALEAAQIRAKLAAVILWVLKPSVAAEGLEEKRRKRR